MLLLTGGVKGDVKLSLLPANTVGVSHPAQATALSLSVARLTVSKESSS